PRRKPRVEGEAPATSAPTEHPVVAAAAAQAPSAGVADAERAPRKRRRRRNGRPVEGAEPAVASTPVAAPAAPRKPTQVVATPVRAANKPSGSPSLLSRIGRRLRSLVSGN
ncbi:ATP-dependent RNA helicase RhlB, partial [Xanthomonas vasicola]